MRRNDSKMSALCMIATLAIVFSGSCVEGIEVVLTAVSGNATVLEADALSDGNWTFVITPTSPSDTIRVNLTEFGYYSTGTGGLTIFDGATTSSEVLLRWEGASPPPDPIIDSTQASSITLELIVESSWSAPGASDPLMNVEYEVVDCSGEPVGDCTGRTCGRGGGCGQSCGTCGWASSVCSPVTGTCIGCSGSSIETGLSGEFTDSGEDAHALGAPRPPSWARCSWSIQPDESLGHTWIRAYMDHFAIPPGGFLNVYDGASPEPVNFVKRIEGNGEGEEAWSTQGDGLFLDYFGPSTPDTVPFGGALNVSWEAAYGVPQPYVSCEGLVELTNSSGTIDDGVNLYSPFVTCSWLIAPEGSFLRTLALDVNSLDIRAGDVVTVYDGDSTDAFVLRTLANQTTGPTIFSNGSSVLIVLETDGEDHGFGFNISWQQIPRPLLILSQRAAVGLGVLLFGAGIWSAYKFQKKGTGAKTQGDIGVSLVDAVGSVSDGPPRPPPGGLKPLLPESADRKSEVSTNSWFDPNADKPPGFEETRKGTLSGPGIDATSGSHTESEVSVEISDNKKMSMTEIITGKANKPSNTLSRSYVQIPVGQEGSTLAYNSLLVRQEKEKAEKEAREKAEKEAKKKRKTSRGSKGSRGTKDRSASRTSKGSKGSKGRSRSTSKGSKGGRKRSKGSKSKEKRRRASDDNSGLSGGAAEDVVVDPNPVSF